MHAMLACWLMGTMAVSNGNLELQWYECQKQCRNFACVPFQLASILLFSHMNHTPVKALELRNEFLMIKFIAGSCCLGYLEGKICLRFSKHFRDIS